MADGFDIFGGFGASSSRQRERAPSSSNEREGRGGFDVFGGHGGKKKGGKTAVRIDEGTLENVEKNVGGAVRVLKVLGIL